MTTNTSVNYKGMHGTYPRQQFNNIYDIVVDTTLEYISLVTAPTGPTGPTGPSGAQGAPISEVRVISSDDTILTTDYIIRSDGDTNITIPLSTDLPGRNFNIINVSGTATLTFSGVELLNGVYSTYTMYYPNDIIGIVSDGNGGWLSI